MVVANTILFWVQLYGVPMGFVSKMVCRDIRNVIGNFTEFDTKNFMGAWRKYIRIRVYVDVTKELK